MQHSDEQQPAESMHSSGAWAGSRGIVPETLFPILPWDRLDATRESWPASLKACHFNVAGFIAPEDVAVCERLGLNVIGDLGVTRREWVTLSDVQIAQRARERIAAFGDSAAVNGFYLCDEPEIEEFETQGKVVAAVKRYAPGKLAYINLFPEHHKRLDIVRDHSDYSYADYLEVFIDKVRPQFISYNNYTIQYSMNLRDAHRGASYFRNLVTARTVAYKHNLPFWNVVAGHQLRPYSMPPSFANLLLQANTTLAAGGRSVAWYQYGLPRAPNSTCYAQAAVDAYDRLTPTWRWLQEVNRQLGIVGPVMNRLVSTGVAFTSPLFDPLLPGLPGRTIQHCVGTLIEAIDDPNAPLPAAPPPSLTIRHASQTAPLMIGEFRDIQGADYVMKERCFMASSYQPRRIYQGRRERSRLPSIAVDCYRLLSKCASLLVLLLLALNARAQPIDWDRLLSQADASANTFQRNMDWSVGKAIRDDPKLRRQWLDRWTPFIQKYPGTHEAARAELFFIDDLVQREDWPELAPAATRFFARYAEDASLHGRVLEHLGRSLLNTNVPPAVRRANFDVFSQHLAGHPQRIFSSRNYLVGLGLPADETLSLAERAAYTCGSNVNSRVYLWQFLARAMPATDDDATFWRTAGHRFLAHFGTANPESRAAQLALLELDVRDGIADAATRLAEARAADRAADTTLKAAFDALRAALAEGRTGPALVELGTALGAAPIYSADPHWSRLLNDKLLPSLPPDLLADLLTVTLELAPTGQATEVARNLARNVLKGHPQEGSLLIAYLERHVEDVDIAIGTALYLTRYVPAVTADPDLAARAAHAAMGAALRLGARDSAAEYAFLCGSDLWSIDQPAAEQLLEQALTLAPASRHAARAGWLLAFLRSEIDFARPPLPHGVPPPDEVSVAWPAWPKTVPTPVTVQTTKEGVSLAAWDRDEDLAAGQTPRAVLTPEAVGKATDGDATTAWLPSQLPAVIVVPLRRASPVRRVVITTAGDCYYVVTLHDAAGRALARAERDWSFPDNSDFWPEQQTTLEFLPGQAASFVSVELTACRGTAGGVAELAVFGTTHNLEASHEFAPMTLPANVPALRISWQADEPTVPVSYRANLESTRGFVVTRWINPWIRSAGPLRLDQVGGHLGLSCYGGANITLRLARAGIVDWRFAGAASGTITQTNVAEQAHALEPLLPAKRQLLTLGRRALPAANDRWGADDVRFVSLEMQGRTCVKGSIRFGDGHAKWDAWRGPLTNGTAVVVPGEATHYQLRADFDSREVLGETTARLVKWDVAAAGPTSPTGLTNPTNPMREDLDAALKLVAARGVVATYPRGGCRREYDAAKRIAEKARLYLVSDDHALNNYAGLPLVIGRPLTHRYARQAVAMAGIWNDPDYLNSPSGLVSVVRHDDGTPWYVLAIGETAAAVESAAGRLLTGLPARPEPQTAFRLFAADTLEVVYAWQLHPERPLPEDATLQMGINDRRSLQIGIAAERELGDLRAELGYLRRADGTALSAVTQIRFSGFYEWDGFFGDLRLPNALIPKPYLPMPANTAMGIWVTVQTTREAQPGVYTGLLNLQSGGQLQALRVQVTVEPVPLPDFGTTAFYSFAHPAWWFKAGTPLHERAVRELARNEARHGVQWLGTHVSYRVARATESTTEAGTLAKAAGVPPSGGSSPGLQPPSSAAAAREPLFTLDFTPWEKDLRHSEEEYAALGLPPPNFLGPFDDLNALVRISGTNDTAWVARQAAEQLAAYLQRTGRTDRFILKVSDEPRSLAEWMVLARPWREGGLRIMTCHNGNDATLESAIGAMDPWCPNYQHDVLKPFFRERQQAGDAVWWYCCGVPPTRLTGQPEDNLPFYWLTAKWHFDGAMSYAAHAMSPNSVETSPVPFRYEHGLSHRLLYRLDGTLLDTWRRELEGDGIRDNMLIEWTRARIDKMRLQPAKRVQAEALDTRLDALLDRVVPYKYGYADTPAAWQNARRELYGLAVAASSE